MTASFAAAGRPNLSDGSPADARALVASGRAALGPAPEVGSIRDIDIPTRGGSIGARLITPTSPSAGLVVYVHGGGWLAGTLDDYEICARRLAVTSGCSVLMPDYRLAPENPFPNGLEDCEDALRYASRHRAELGCGDGPVIACGDSAGANLVTVALRRLGGEVACALQVLIYPVTDCDFGTRSYREHGTGLPLTRQDMTWFFDHYAPRAEHPRDEISPLRAPDLSGQPPAVVVTAQYDVLRDEGRAYAQRLSQAGVAVVYREAAGLTHGFVRLHNLIAEADAELVAIGAAIATACAAN
ncbi:hypothetical protein AE618_08590 [Bosea vaviloviae]|uniref:Alpha/beta hydrolase fold-3 domain-containing protein n=2 Tax=Bosea vaviloviae TaxID=1526658 RepID=A0A0N1F5L8_9HYPH|nr:hypothetical protein AE618_08590 [Bosea vaviloviae]